MEYVVQAFKVLKNLLHAEANARAPKSAFFAAFLSQTRFVCVIINACLDFCINYNMKLASYFTKVHVLLFADRPLGISLRFLANAKIQACIKSIGNHAKKSCLASFLELSRLPRPAPNFLKL